MILHAPNLRVLRIRNEAMEGGTGFIHRLASTDTSWQQLEEFELESTRRHSEV